MTPVHPPPQSPGDASSAGGHRPWRTHRALAGALLSLLALPTTAFGETFDIATYTAPAGWERTDQAGARGYTAVDRKAGTFCRLVLFASGNSSGDVRRDFDVDWAELMAKPLSTQPPTLQAPRAAGAWQVVTGVAPFVWESKRAGAALAVYSGGGRRFTVQSMGTADCSPAMQALLASLVLPQPTAPTAPAAGTPAAQANTPNPDPGTTTTFNHPQGWSVTAGPDHVLARRGAVTVRLHPATPIPDALRADPEGLRQHLWQTQVLPRYGNVGNVQASRLSAFDDNEWIAADAQERDGQRRVRVVLHLSRAGGMATGVEIAAPGAAEINAVAATTPQAMALLGLNRFPVQAAELPGTWAESGSSVAQYANVYTGAYAGMGVAAGAYKISFTPDGRFTSEFKGASGMTGQLAFAREARAGTWRLQNDRLETDANGVRRTYAVWFEVVRGGRVLHVQDVMRSGSHDVLARR